MQFTISGEIDHTVGESFRILGNQTEKKLNDCLGGKDYGDAVSLLFLAPIILTNHFRILFDFKERKLYRKKDKSTDYRLAIDYDEFVNADDGGKRLLLVENIIHAIRDVKRKIKKGFDGERLESDILSLFNMKPEDIREKDNRKAP